ncbi:hypothetical protein [Sphingomonas oryzagri]|uniref:Uncharacterized protein n=1 Tax=Sphingomonas oryzagri TaxID=3042314 RepID=A0ABT6N1K2_9SPHN|nr:hypothetical protein [Sphingomonas oryzagri]MDH7638936.1 hypothetical protein [Sphingomonas oryzagri]
MSATLNKLVNGQWVKIPLRVVPPVNMMFRPGEQPFPIHFAGVK